MDHPLMELFRHNAWANEKLLDACEKLDEAQLGASVPGVYGTIRDTLHHLFAAETRYIAMIRSEPRPDELDEEKPYPGLTELRRYARLTGDELTSLAERAAPDQRLKGATRRGVAYDLPVSVLLAQAINHGTEHRANVTTIMSALGLGAPQLDLWQYAQERAHDRAQTTR
jgi:uncharacterized damage-inducible protein DinB